MQILPLGEPLKQFLAVNVEHNLSLLLAVEFTGFQPLHEVLVDLRDEAALHVVEHVHLREDRGDQAVHLQACRLMARRLADHDFLDELSHDWHQHALGFLVLALAGHHHELAHGHLRLFRIMPAAQFLDLGDHVRAAFRETGDLHLKDLSFCLQPVERIVEGRQARAAFRRTVADLLDDVLLLALEFRELALHLVALGKRTFEFCRLVGDAPLG
ncbi:hypothetical protein [Agrobacterium tumefaciens]|uniref:hypothetical protein n=1 Tax=Agrobacterium tumefaciens TaxID=358 RepID=UPI00055045FE|nr:hypothetical protein [Agrobacterium tumefaciens]